MKVLCGVLALEVVGDAGVTASQRCQPSYGLAALRYSPGEQARDCMMWIISLAFMKNKIAQ